MKKTKSVFITLIITQICLNSCTKEVGYPEPNKKASTATTCDSSIVTYSNFVSIVMSNNCTLSGCHNVGSSFDLTTYNNVKLKVDDGTFYERVFVQKDMPPSYLSGAIKLDDCTMGKLKKWINNGAPQ